MGIKEVGKKGVNFAIKVVSWIVVGFFVLIALVFMPSVTSILLLIAAALLVPIVKWQTMIKKLSPKKWIKPVLIVVLFIFAIIATPATTEAENHVDAEMPVMTASPEPTALPTEAPTPEPTEAPTPEPTEEPTPEPTEIPEDSTFEVHFIDVGQADAALVLCDGEAMLIDGGNREDSSLIYSYLKTYDIAHLDYIVATHAHEDHVGGLSGALNFATVETAFCSVTDHDTEVFANFVKYLGEQDVSITLPTAGDSFMLGSATVEIIGPITESNDPNNMSIVLRIVYGETSFLFTGDAEREEEQDILNAGYTLKSTVLKVGHHGSENSTTYPFLYEIMPEYAVISVGEGNSYGHPTEEALSRLRDADVTVYRTDLQGHIICTSDGNTVTFSVQRNADVDTLATTTPTPVPTVAPTAEPSVEEDEGIDYVLNTNSKKFHYPGCSSVGKMSEKNKGYYTGTREEVIARGYSPCGNCHP